MRWETTALKIQRLKSPVIGSLNPVYFALQWHCDLHRVWTVFPPFSISKPACKNCFCASALPARACSPLILGDVKTSSVLTDLCFSGSETGCESSLSSRIHKSLPPPPLQYPTSLLLPPFFLFVCFTLRRTRLFSLIDSLWPPVMPLKDHGNTPSVSSYHSSNHASSPNEGLVWEYIFIFIKWIRAISITTNKRALLHVIPSLSSVSCLNFSSKRQVI